MAPFPAGASTAAVLRDLRPVAGFGCGMFAHWRPMIIRLRTLAARDRVRFDAYVAPGVKRSRRVCEGAAGMNKAYGRKRAAGAAWAWRQSEVRPEYWSGGGRERLTSTPGTVPGRRCRS